MNHDKALIQCSGLSNLWKAVQTVQLPLTACFLPPPMSHAAVRKIQTSTARRSGTFQFDNRFCHFGNFDKLHVFVVTFLCIFSQHFVTAVTETDVCATAVLKKKTRWHADSLFSKQCCSSWIVQMNLNLNVLIICFKENNLQSLITNNTAVLWPIKY